MNLCQRFYRYIKLHFFRNPRYFFWYLINFFNPQYIPRISFLDTDTVAKLVAAGKSVVRLGDGEIYLLNHGDIPFERSTPRLRELMLASIREYHAESPYVVALNRVPLQMTNKELKNKKVLSSWLPSKVYFNLYFNRNESYADAAMFYFKDTIPKYFESYLVTKRVIFVSNARVCEAFRKNEKIPFTVLSTVITPETSSFTEYDRIKNEVIEAVQSVGKEHVVVLAAFGPASKVLAYELSQIGIQVLDVGQGITAAYTDSDHSLSENIRVLQ